MKYQMQQLEEMLDNALNHASVITWGWFNEGQLLWLSTSNRTWYWSMYIYWDIGIYIEGGGLTMVSF